jgi:hypothetical protein
VDDEFTVVRLEANFASKRAEKGGNTIIGSVVGVGGSAVALVLGVMVPVAVAPGLVLIAGTYYAARRSHLHMLNRATIALEQALDRLERGDAKQPSLLRLIEAALPPTR